MAKILVHWQNVIVLGDDAESRLGCFATADEITRDEILAVLDEYHQSGGVLDYFLAPLPGQEKHEPWEWGPAPNEIDWTGFDASTSTLAAHRRLLKGHPVE